MRREFLVPLRERHQFKVLDTSIAQIAIYEADDVFGRYRTVGLSCSGNLPSKDSSSGGAAYSAKAPTWAERSLPFRKVEWIVAVGAPVVRGIYETGFEFGSVPSLRTLGYKSPNEKLNIASIGAGGKAASDISGCASENIVALCDVDDARAAETFKRHEKVPKYKDFRRMLDEQGNNIDAVIVSIPDFMHATAAMWCMERGKHVYVQKPLTRTVWEARQLQEGANKYRVASQMGNQGYSNEGTRQAAEMIWAGEIGNVTKVHAWTNRPIWPQGLTQIPPPDRVPETVANRTSDREREPTSHAHAAI